MYPFQAQQGIQRRVPAAVADLASVFVAKLTRRIRTKASAVPTCEGYAWCDSLEHQVITDGANFRRTRL